MALQGQLYPYHRKRLTLFESGDLSSSSVLILIGGLTDGIGSVPYVPDLSGALAQIGWSVAQITLSSSYNQYGLSSLEKDAVEIEHAINFLRRERGKDKIVLQGHSTGCQDAMRYLTAHPSTRPTISGAILQAPVSDLEFFESTATPEARKWVSVAKDMVTSGQGGEWLPQEAALSIVAQGDGVFGNPVPITAYRFASLYAAGGDDDYFSSITPTDRLQFNLAAAPLLLLLGDEDQYYPPHLGSTDAKEKLLQKWKSQAEGKIVGLSAVVPKANHAIDDREARAHMIKLVLEFVKSL